MTKDTMKKLNIEGLRTKPKNLQVLDCSTVTPNGVIEDTVTYTTSTKSK